MLILRLQEKEQDYFNNPFELCNVSLKKMISVNECSKIQLEWKENANVLTLE